MWFVFLLSVVGGPGWFPHQGKVVVAPYYQINVNAASRTTNLRRQW